MAIDVKEYLESVREKKRRVARMETALAENRARAEQVSGLQITEKVQTSTKSSIDTILEALEEERIRLEEAQTELDEMVQKAKLLINTIRDDETAWSILYERFIIGESWKNISRRMHYTRRALFNISEGGIEKIQRKIAHGFT